MKDGVSDGTEPLGTGGGEPEAGEGSAPVSEELIWKARAEDAEARAEELEARVGALETALREANAAAESAELRRQIERELAEADALDLEACCMLTEAAVAQMDEPDVARAVRDLRQRKPFLFQGPASPAPGATMVPGGVGSDGLVEMAERARSSGDRAALLRYLRQRRG